MLLLEPFTKDQGRLMLHLAIGTLNLLSLRFTGFSTRKLAYVLDSLVRVSRRVSWSHFDKISLKETLRHYDTIFTKDSNQKEGAFSSAFIIYNTSFCLLIAINHNIELTLSNQWRIAVGLIPDKEALSQPESFFNCFLFNDFKSFNPLFKVLFIFPSQYLFAIGFP